MKDGKSNLRRKKFIQSSMTLIKSMDQDNTNHLLLTLTIAINTRTNLNLIILLGLLIPTITKGLLILILIFTRHLSHHPIYLSHIYPPLCLQINNPHLSFILLITSDLVNRIPINLLIFLITTSIIPVFLMALIAPTILFMDI